MILDSALESPTRRMLTGKARVAIFKDASSEEPEDAESGRSRVGSEALDEVGNLQGAVQ